MAILRGFPPSNTISPSVRITEKDLSYIAPSNTFHRAGLVGFASKGPINLPTIVASQRQLNTIFGYPHPEESDPYLIYAASQYLQIANELYVVRVADDDAVSSEQATTAWVDVPAAGATIQVAAKSSSGIAMSTFRFSTDCFLRWKLNGVSSSRVLVIPAGGIDINTGVWTQFTYQVPNASGIMNLLKEDTDDPHMTNSDGTSHQMQVDGVTYKNIILQLNSQLDYSNPAELGYLDGISFYNDSGNLAVQTLWAAGPTCSFEFVSVGNSALHPMASTLSGAASPDTGLGFGSEMEAAILPGYYDYYPQTGSHPISGGWVVPSSMNLLEVVVDGTGNDNIDNAVQVINLADVFNNTEVTTADIVKSINRQINNGYTDGHTTWLIPGGFCAVGGGINGTTVGAGYTPKLPADGSGIDRFVDYEVLFADEVESTDDFPGAPNDYSSMGTATTLDLAAKYITLATLHKGRDARIYIRPSSTASAALGFNQVDQYGHNINNDTAMGYTPYGTAGATRDEAFGLWYGASNSGVNTFRLTADSAGIEGNNTQVLIKNDVREGVFTLEVYNNGAQVESWGYLTKDDTSRYYVETFLALTSDFLRCIDNTATKALPLEKTGQTYYSLSGGNDGIPSDPDLQDELLMGSLLGYTGMYALSEPEQIDIDLIAVPGHASTDVIYELLNLCQSVRMDCLAIIDPPFGLTVKEIVQWQNGLHPLNMTRFDSDFGALYWPWVKMRDTYNRVDVWVPPSGSVMATIARSDNLAEPWFAPAGVNRGIVPGITDVFSRPTLEERDTMYGNRNCINPIVQFAEYQDFMIWGQKTLQRRPTALDRVNVRRLMFVLEKRIRAGSKAMLFDPHDDEFHRRWTVMAAGIMEEVKAGRGLHDYIIDAGWDLNTPDVVDRNEFRARIGVQPTRAVEFIFIEFSIHRTGSFNESTEQPYYGG